MLELAIAPRRPLGAISQERTDRAPMAASKYWKHPTTWGKPREPWGTAHGFQSPWVRRPLHVRNGDQGIVVEGQAQLFVGQRWHSKYDPSRMKAFYYSTHPPASGTLPETNPEGHLPQGYSFEVKEIFNSATHCSVRIQTDDGYVGWVNVWKMCERGENGMEEDLGLMVCYPDGYQQPHGWRASGGWGGSGNDNDWSGNGKGGGGGGSSGGDGGAAGGGWAGGGNGRGGWGDGGPSGGGHGGGQNYGHGGKWSGGGNGGGWSGGWSDGWSGGQNHGCGGGRYGGDGRKGGGGHKGGGGYGGGRGGGGYGGGRGGGGYGGGGDSGVGAAGADDESRDVLAVLGDVRELAQKVRPGHGVLQVVMGGSRRTRPGQSHEGQHAPQSKEGQRGPGNPEVTGASLASPGTAAWPNFAAAQQEEEEERTGAAPSLQAAQEAE